MLRILVFLPFVTSPVFSQNYVVNGGFERKPPEARGEPGACAFSGSPDIFPMYAQGWSTYTGMTPDLLVADSAADCALFSHPRRGKRMAGLIMFHPYSDGNVGTDYHELLQGTLAQPLEKGKTYRVRFWTRTDDSIGVRHLSGVYGRIPNIRPVRCGNFGFYFSKEKINLRENFMVSQSVFPLQPQINRADIVETPGGEWRQISLLFKADQPYRYFLFGNFFFDPVTLTNLSDAERFHIDSINQANGDLDKRIKRIAYYCFDDFVVEELPAGDFSKTLLDKNQLVFDAEVLFDTDQDILKPAALPALDQLVNALGELPEKRIEIGGHTDNTGGTKHNQDLSERRARSVYDYLLGKGVPGARLNWRGYGESQPVVPNDNDANRQKNRRVEVKLGH